MTLKLLNLIHNFSCTKCDLKNNNHFFYIYLFKVKCEFLISTWKTNWMNNFVWPLTPRSFVNIYIVQLTFRVCLIISNQIVVCTFWFLFFDKFRTLWNLQNNNKKKAYAVQRQSLNHGSGDFDNEKKNGKNNSFIPVKC